MQPDERLRIDGVRREQVPIVAAPSGKTIEPALSGRT
jgi:hypothetical protein